MKKKVGKAFDKVLESLDPLPPQRTPPILPPPSSSSPSSGLNKSTDSNIFTTLSDMDDLLSSTVNNTKGPGSGGTLDQRLDHILAILMETKAICEQNQREIVTLKEKIISLEKENNTVKRELRVAKESTNRYELATRFLTVRVLGLPVSAEERAAASPEDRNKAAVKNAYDKILRPILSVAKAKGHLEVVPQLKTTIEEGFRINSNAKDKRGVPYPPPLILRFTHKSYRTAVFLFKREAFNPSGGASSDNLNFFIVEDLTIPTLNKMKELRADDRVGKVWTTEGQIRFTLVDAPSKVLKFRGVYAPLSEIIK
jgi:hypothetical protein